MVSTISGIHLTTSSGSLTVSPDENGVGDWCQVHLLASGERQPLGAETLKYIAAHLRSFLEDSSPGQRWVFSLSELHTSAYGEHLAEGATIHLHDADATMFARLVLTPAEITEWLSKMSNLVAT